MIRHTPTACAACGAPLNTTTIDVYTVILLDRRRIRAPLCTDTRACLKRSATLARQDARKENEHAAP